MQKPSRLLPDDSHHLMATDCVLPQVALWGKGMVCALKRTSGLNGWISNQKHISLQSVALREGSRGFEEIEFLTVHKSKGLEANYVILLQCNKDTYGFPSQVSDDPVLNYVLTKSDQFPYGEERRLFYVAITRAKIKTLVLYDKRFPSVFVDEFLHPEKVSEESYVKHPNANKRWTRSADQFLLKLHNEGKSVKYIANKMGRSQTSIVMRLNKLKK